MPIWKMLSLLRLAVAVPFALGVTALATQSPEPPADAPAHENATLPPPLQVLVPPSSDMATWFGLRSMSMRQGSRISTCMIGRGRLSGP